VSSPRGDLARPGQSPKATTALGVSQINTVHAGCGLKRADIAPIAANERPFYLALQAIVGWWSRKCATGLSLNDTLMI